MRDEHFATMEQCMKEMDQAVKLGDPHAIGRANRRFHLTIIEPSGWDRYLRILNQLWDNSEPYWSFMSPDQELHANRRAQHQAILDAVRARDVPLVTKLLDSHRMDISQGTLQLLADFDGES
jgi:DNA-binding GntR family transcriptional regulator